MAPPRCLCRALLPALALALLGLAAAAGPRQTPALELAEELAEELWSAGLPGDLPELEPECRSLLAAFAEGSAALTECLGRRARPVRLCQGCHGHYRRLLALYGGIARAVGVRPWGRGGARLPGRAGAWPLPWGFPACGFGAGARQAAEDPGEGRLNAPLGARGRTWERLGRAAVCCSVRASSWRGRGQAAPPAEKALRVEKLELFLLMRQWLKRCSGSQAV